MNETIITLHKGNTETTVLKVRETPKAILVKGNASEAWFPKAGVDVLGHNEVTGHLVVEIQDWFGSKLTLAHQFLFEAPFKP